jgi:hypothetical protein
MRRVVAAEGDERAARVHDGDRHRPAVATRLDSAAASTRAAPCAPTRRASTSGVTCPDAGQRLRVRPRRRESERDGEDERRGGAPEAGVGMGRGSR